MCVATVWRAALRRLMRCRPDVVGPAPVALQWSAGEPTPGPPRDLGLVLMVLFKTWCHFTLAICCSCKKSLTARKFAMALVFVSELAVKDWPAAARALGEQAFM